MTAIVTTTKKINPTEFTHKGHGDGKDLLFDGDGVFTIITSSELTQQELQAAVDAYVHESGWQAPVEVDPAEQKRADLLEKAKNKTLKPDEIIEAIEIALEL
jgi:hypothetical protein